MSAPRKAVFRPLSLIALSAVLLPWLAWSATADRWAGQWPNTDFSRATVPLEEIISGGPGKDGIPAIDNPRFVSVAEYDEIDAQEPVIGLMIGDQARAYPLRILMWHEIVNDSVAGIPVAVTYCPLCNTSIVFDRRVGNQMLDFGTSGNLRHSDLIMYDRQTESWWQQFGGEAIVGRLTGTSLSVIPSRLESITEFRQRAPQGRVLVPSNPSARDYTRNPYAGYDRSALPFLFNGKMPKHLPPMMRVVAVDDIGFALPYLRAVGTIDQQGITLSWRSGQRSALDAAQIARGRDVGSVVVTRAGEEVAYVVTFAFAFYAFNPEGVVYTADGPVGRD